MNTLKTALLGASVMIGLSLPAAAAVPTHAMGLAITGRADAKKTVTFDVILPLRDRTGLEALVAAQQDEKSPQYHKWLTPAQFGKRFGPTAATEKKVADYLRARGFTVKTQTRSLHVSGTVDAVQRNFGTSLVVAQAPSGRSHAVSLQPLKMPAVLASTGAQIHSFVPHSMSTYSHVISGPLTADQDKNGSRNRTGATGSYWFDDLKQAYQYPSALDTVTVKGQTLPLNGKGATIAVLMDSDVLDSDIAAMFDHELWSTVTGSADPVLAGRRYIDGGAPFGGNDSVEASLDTQQELTGAPGANVVLYDIPDLFDSNVMAGFIDLVENDAVDLVSSSFGGCELFYTAKYNGGQDFTGVLRSFHEVFLQGNAQGITFLSSSGDLAGGQCPSLSYLKGKKGKAVPSVSVLSDDPNVTAVGGTNLVTSFTAGSLDSTYVGENAWSDPEIPQDPYGTGGVLNGDTWGAGSGVSVLWSAPDYQSLVSTGSSMRAVPDIGMQVGGCPGGTAILDGGKCDGGNNAQNGAGNSQRSAVKVAFNVGHSGGGIFGVIGTSVSSPEFAGAVAHLIETKGRQGNINNYIYKLAAKQAAGGKTYFHTGIPGFNGFVDTNVSPTYSLSTGVGTPIVTTFIGQPKAPQAGTPQSPSNP